MYFISIVVPRKVFRSLHAGVILFMDLYICCTFTSTCTAADDLSLDELLTRVRNNGAMTSFIYM